MSVPLAEKKPFSPPTKRPALSRATLWRILLLVPIGGVAWLLGQTPSGVTPQDAGGPGIEAEGVRHFLLQDGGKKLCEGSARRVTVAPDKKSLLAEEVQGGTLFRDGKPALKLSAKRVRVIMDSGDIAAFGGVQASGNEFSLAAPEARWQHQQARLFWPAQAHAAWRGVQFVAANAFYDARAQELVCPQPMSAFVPNRVNLRAARAVASLPSHRLSLRGGIELIFRPAPNAPLLPGVIEH